MSAAILAPLAVERIEDGVRRYVAQLGDPAGILGIDLDHIVTEPAQRVSAAFAGTEAHWPLGA